MKTFLLLAFFVAWSGVALADSNISAVFVKDSEIVISTESDEQVQLTNDGIPKSLPVWSKDGSKIAFIEKTDRNIALSRLSVISRGGSRLFSILIHPAPTDPREVVTGMRFVERVEWVTGSRIAVSGSINPSTCENIVFDVFTGSIVNEFYDDGCNAAYSQDGRHVAYMTGAPHFTPESRRERELIVDGKSVFPRRGTQVKFITDPKWNADSKTLAIVATRDKTGTSSMVMWRAKGGKLSTIRIPMKKGVVAEGEAELFWNGQDLILTSPEQAWSFSKGRPREIDRSLALLLNQNQEATEMKKERAVSLPPGVEKPDFWCPSCALSLAPRRSSVNDE